MGTLPKRPLGELKPIADELVVRLKPSCERIEIAGSIRRGRPMVGDIELIERAPGEEEAPTHQSCLDAPFPQRATQVSATQRMSGVSPLPRLK